MLRVGLMKEKLPYIILGGIFVVGLILIFFGKPPEQRPTTADTARMKPTPTYIPYTVPQSKLWLVSDSEAIDERKSKVSKSDIPLVVMLSSKENRISSVQLELSYDPKALKFVSIEAISLLAGKHIAVNKVDEVNGRISFGAETTPGKHQAPIQGTEELVDIVFRPLQKTGATEVKVLPTSVIKADGITGSSLVDTKSITLELAK